MGSYYPHPTQRFPVPGGWPHQAHDIIHRRSPSGMGDLPYQDHEDQPGANMDPHAGTPDKRDTEFRFSEAKTKLNLDITADVRTPLLAFAPCRIQAQGNPPGPLPLPCLRRGVRGPELRGEEKKSKDPDVCRLPGSAEPQSDMR